MTSCCLEDIDSTGLHGGPRLIPMFTEIRHIAFLGETAGTGTKAPGLVITVQKGLNLKTNDNRIEVLRPLFDNRSLRVS